MILTSRMRVRLLVTLAAMAILASCSPSSDTPETGAPATTSAPQAGATSTVPADTTGSPDTTRRRDRVRPERTTITTAPPTTTQPAATTTLAPPDPADVDPSTASGVIGVVGCSNTDQAVRGYGEASTAGKLAGGDLGGGAITRWGDPSDDRYARYWDLYDSRRPAAGYDGAWIQLCIRAGEHQGAFDTAEQTWLTHIVEQIRVRDPDITVWVSPINSYVDGHVCDAIGADGPAIAAMAADWGAATLPGVSRGPDTGSLGTEHIGLRDNCHPNRFGEALLGEQLVAAFDG